MADSGVFERRTRGEARAVWAASVTLGGLGWASSVWPVVPGLILVAVVAVCTGVAIRRRSNRLGVARAVREQAAWTQGPPRYAEAGEVFGGAPYKSSYSVVDAVRDAA